MQWFTNWWQSLGFPGQIMACAAIPASIIMLLQLILTVFGAGLGAESDCCAEIDFDGGLDAPDFETDACCDTPEAHGGGFFDGTKLLTVRGLTAFFAIGGWAGIAALTSGVRLIWSIQIALLAGALSMLAAASALKFALRMQSEGNINLKNAINLTAAVYMTVPPNRSKTGKVTLILQNRYTELEAVTDYDCALKPNEKVEIIGIVNGDTVIVRPVMKEAVLQTDIIPNENIDADERVGLI